MALFSHSYVHDLKKLVDKDTAFKIAEPDNKRAKELIKSLFEYAKDVTSDDHNLIKFLNHFKIHAQTVKFNLENAHIATKESMKETREAANNLVHYANEIHNYRERFDKTLKRIEK
ncbi:hypothetical protein C0585_05760 [Candidatus Woesearchaeota archaeon]|nr:MAG: hypothetical protein C0585_05760 [Candidatus Woesearchaeota archaeon]